MKPQVPNPRDAATAWAQTFCTDWEDCRDDPVYGPDNAWALLAACAALYRFFSVLPAEVVSVPAVLQRDSAALLAVLRQGLTPTEWLDRARDVDGAWDYATDDDALRELKMIAIDLFDRLDRHNLVLWMARRLDSGSEAENLNRRAEQLARDEEFFVNHIDAFFPAASLAKAVIAALRPDLEQADPELWKTTRIHHILVDAWNEAEGGTSPSCLTDRDKEAILLKVRQAKLSCPSTWTQATKFSAPEPQFSMAAATAGEAHRMTLARKEFQIEGVEGVEAVLQLDFLPNGIQVRLGPPDRVWQFIRCEMKIPELPAPLIAELPMASGKVMLTEAEVQALGNGHENIVVTLLTADGTRRSTRQRRAA